MLISVVTSFVTAMVVFMVFSQNLLYACTMKTIPAIETNRPTKKYRERKQECSLPRAKSPMRVSSPIRVQTCIALNAPGDLAVCWSPILVDALIAKTLVEDEAAV